MSLYLSELWYYLDQYWDDIGDPRVNHWMLINGGIWKILGTMTIYLIITRIILPEWMKRRKAYKLRNIMFAYNFFMVGANLFGFYWATISLDYGRIFLDFQYPSRDDLSSQTVWYLNLGWLFMLSRFMDLVDTVFIVLRKKDSQITSLHLYHHTVVPILCWVSFKYNGMIPIIRMFVFLNTAIHTVMYGYYAMSSFGPKIKKYLWWKRYITVLQILQFVICGCYGAILLCKQNNYPMGWFAFAVGQNPLFFAMFYDFYKQSYKKREKYAKNDIKDSLINDSNYSY